MTSADGRSDTSSYTTEGGIHVTRERRAIDAQAAIEELIDRLDTRRGVLLSSNYDYPGRYTRWDLVLENPLLEITSRVLRLEVRALSIRGQALLAPIARLFEAMDEADDFRTSAHGLELTIKKPERRFAEEERSRQPSVFSAIRALVKLFSSKRDDQLGLYGAFGYDLTFQFEAIRLKHARPFDQRDMVLYLPEELIVGDRQKETAYRYRYDFRHGSESTGAADPTPYPEPRAPEASPRPYGSDHAPGEYADAVRRAKQLFKQGDLFEL